MSSFSCFISNFSVALYIPLKRSFWSTKTTCSVWRNSLLSFVKPKFFSALGSVPWFPLRPLLGAALEAMLQELREDMKSASGQKDFEKAAVLRDQINAIERLDERERRRGDDRAQRGALGEPAPGRAPAGLHPRPPGDSRGDG